MEKRCLSGIIFVFLIAMSGAFYGYARAYTDVSETRAEKGAIRYLSDNGIVRGQGNGTLFEPDQLLRRAEWATMMIRYKDEEPSIQEYGLCFPDVSDEWFAASVCLAKEKGWVRGYASGLTKGYFGPGDPLNVAEVVVFLDRMFSWSSQEGEDWFSGAYEYAYKANIIAPGELPSHLVSRAEAAEMLFRAIAIQKYHILSFDPIVADLLVNKELSTSGEEEENPVLEPINVSIQPFPDDINKSSVANGATYVPVLRFQMEAEKELSLEQFTVKRVSVSRTEDIEKARIMMNGKVVKEGFFMNSSSESVWRNLSATLHPGEVFLIEMTVDFSPESLPGTNFAFELDPEKIIFDQAVSIEGEKIRGGNFDLVSISAATVRISNPTSPLRLPFIEEDKQVVGRFDITAGEHDLLIKRIRLEDGGRINKGDYQHFRLSVGSQEVGYLEDIAGYVLDFVVDDYFLEKNRTRTFSIRADIGLARKTDNIRFYMEEPGHLYAYDVEFAYGARVENEFDRIKALCVGSKNPECPTEGLRKRCSKDDIEAGVRDCKVDEEETQTITECPSTLAPVCGSMGDSAPQTFNNRCLAEKVGATNINTGPCSP